jgi:hypothetical protein
MTKRPLRVYADTSVYGGVFEEEFRIAINAVEGYSEIRIHTPQEVIDYESHDL